jgi:hypothetical protein
MGKQVCPYMYNHILVLDTNTHHDRRNHELVRESKPHHSIWSLHWHPRCWYLVLATRAVTRDAKTWGNVFFSCRSLRIHAWKRATGAVTAVLPVHVNGYEEADIRSGCPESFSFIITAYGDQRC